MEERVRVAGIIKINGGYAFMHRKNVIKIVTRKRMEANYASLNESVGFFRWREKGETPEEGVIREIKEEFGITIKPIKKLYEMKSEKFNQKEIFFLCEYVEGEFGTGDGPEFNNDPKYIDSGEYLPEIIKESEIKNLLLLPTEIKEKFVKDLENGRI